jgi:hypothetical protein
MMENFFKTLEGTMFNRILIPIVLVMAVAGCGRQSSADASAVPASNVISGPLTEASYDRAAAKTLGEVQASMADPSIAENQLDSEMARIQSLLELSDKLNVDKSKLSDAELTSTLGALYARKAVFHVNNVEEAGALTASGFRYLDRAVAKYPDNLTARINRGITSAKLPAFMNKTDVARDDLSFVVNSPDFGKLSPALQGTIKSLLASVQQRQANGASQK